MIIDCHTHLWPDRGTLGKATDFSCLCGPDISQAGANSHADATDPADKSVILGFSSRLLGAEISNSTIKNCVNQHPGKLIGFAGVDPTTIADPLNHLQNLVSDGFKGIVLCPALQGCHPCDTRTLRVYEAANELALPVYFLYGNVLPRQACLEYASPILLDEIARNYPDMKIILSHLGFPWVEATIAMLAKNPNVLADITGLTRKPWQAYRTLTLAYEYGVIEKLLFGSDFPHATVKETIEALYNLNKVTLNSVLPAVPRELLRGIIERDSLTLMGIK